ncbi:MAG: Rrf2 family transcriptional regulator [Synergistaceae bacterium]|jgi:Rrf2 family protein|nr:Rrf2 family transcriptional regulator [Synergistaceae bacterium]
MPEIVQVSEAVSLAFHGLGLLVSRKGRVSIREMAGIMGVSEAHLAKVFQRLSKGGLVRSLRGPGGGFVLAKDPTEISLYEVYTLIEGEPDVNICLLDCGKCPFQKCLFEGLLVRMKQEFIEFLKKKRLSQLEE